MERFKIGPGEARWEFDNHIVVHVRNADGGYASVVTWDDTTGAFYCRGEFCARTPGADCEQSLSAVELAAFLWRMSHYPEMVP